MAELFYSLKQFEKTGVSYRKAIELDVRYKPRYDDKIRELFNKGVDLRCQGQRNEALPFFQQVVLLDPENKQAQYYVSELQSTPIPNIHRDPDQFQPAQDKGRIGSDINNEWYISTSYPSIHPANCRCVECWEP